MNHDQFIIQCGGDGRFPLRQDGLAGQGTSPRLDSLPTLTQMANWPLHSSPMQPAPHNLSSARLRWQADNSQSPIPPLPALLPILPAHRTHSTNVCNAALDLTVSRLLSVPAGSEEPIDMTVTSRVVSDHSRVVPDDGDAPLALTNKVSLGQADETQNHPINLNKSQKSKKSPQGDASSSVSGSRKPSKASEPVSDTTAFDVSPRRVTRQSVRSGQAALAAQYLSPASTMEAVEGLLMLPQLSTSDASPMEVSPPALRPLKFPRKALRPMRLQAERTTRNSVVFSTHLESSGMPSKINNEETSTPSASTASLSKVQPAVKTMPCNIQSTDNLRQSNSMVSALHAPVVAQLHVASCPSTTAAAETASVVTQPLDLVTTMMEATMQNLNQSGSKTNRSEQSCIVTLESSCDIEGRQVSAVSSIATSCLSGPVVETDSLLSYAHCTISGAGAMPFVTGSMPLNAGSMASDMGSVPYYAGSMPTDTLCLPSNVGSRLVDTDSTPNDIVCLPSDAGSMSDTLCITSDAGSIPDAGSLPIGAGSMPADTDSLFTDAGSLPTDNVCMPSDADSMPGTDSMITDTACLPNDAGSLPTAIDFMPTDTACLPNDGSSMPGETDVMPTDTDSVPTETDVMPTSAGSTAEPSVDLNRQIASLASLDLTQTKQLILSLYHHLETLERTQLSADVTDHSANNNQVAESHDAERCQHDTSHDLAENKVSVSHSDSRCQEHELASRTTGDSIAAVESGTIETNDDDNKQKQKSDVSVVEQNVITSPTSLEDNKQSADKAAVSSVGAEVSNTNCAEDEALPPEDDQLPVSHGEPPFEPMVTASEDDQRPVQVSHGELLFEPMVTASEDDQRPVQVSHGEPPFEPMVTASEDDQRPVQVSHGVPPFELMVTASEDDQRPVQVSYGVPPFEPMVTALEDDQRPVQVSYGEPPFELVVTASEDDQRPVQVSHGVPPFEPMVTASEDDQLPQVQVSHGELPFEPMVAESDAQLVEIPPGYFAVPFTTVGDFFPHQEQPVIIFVNSPQYLETTALPNQHLGAFELHALPTQSIDEVQPQLLRSDQATPVEPHLLTSQLKTSMEPHLLTSQLETLMEPHLLTSQLENSIEPHLLISQPENPMEPRLLTSQLENSMGPHLLTSQQVSLETSHSHTSQQVTPVQSDSITAQQITLVPGAPHSHHVSIQEPIILTSQQATSVQPQLHVLVNEQTSITESCSFASHQIVLQEPAEVTCQQKGQQVSLLELQTLSNHTIVPFEYAAVTSQPVSPLESTALTSRQDEAVPWLAEDSSAWVGRSSYQSSLKLETISPPSSVMSMNDVEDVEENSNTGIFNSTRKFEGNSSHPPVEVGSVGDKEERFQMNNVEDAEENASADVYNSIEELERISSHPVVEVGSAGDKKEQLQMNNVEDAEENYTTDVFSSIEELERVSGHVGSGWEKEEQMEATGGQESDGLTFAEVERNTSLLVARMLLEDVVDTVELGSEPQCEVVHFGAEDLTEVVANEEVETADLDDDEESQESLSLRLSISSDEDITDFDADPSDDSFMKTNQFSVHELAADRNHLEPFYPSFELSNRTTVDSDDEMTENDDCFLSECSGAHDHRIQGTHRIRRSRDNLIELRAEEHGTGIRVNPDLLPKDIMSLFNCSVVIKMLKLSQQPPSGEANEKSMTGNKKQRRARSKQTLEMTGKGFRGRHWESDAAVEAVVEEVHRMVVAQLSGKDDDVRTEPLETGSIQIVNSFTTVNHDPAISAVHMNQEHDSGVQHDEPAVHLNIKNDCAVVLRKPSAFNVNSTDNSEIEPNAETDIPANSFLPIRPEHERAAEAVNAPVGAYSIIDCDLVHTEDTAVSAGSSISQLSGHLDDEKSSSRAESDDRRVGKKICKISVSGLSRPPKLDRVSMCPTPTSSQKSLGNMELPATSTSPLAFKGASLDSREDWTPKVLDVNCHTETVGVIKSIVEPEVMARDRREDRNIFRILLVGSRPETVVAETEQGEMRQMASHKMSNTVVHTLRSIFQGVPQMAENRERLIPTSDRGQSGDSSLPKPHEMVLNCGESSGGVDYHQIIDLNDGEHVADDLRSINVGNQELKSQAEEIPVSGSVASSFKAGEMLVPACGTVHSSETVVSSSETPCIAGEMVVNSGATVSSGGAVAGLSETTLSSVTVLVISGETVANSSETLDSSVEMVTPDEPVDKPGETTSSSNERIITFVEPRPGIGETVERKDDTDYDDDNENFFSEGNEYPMEQDDTGNATLDSKERPIGRASWEENILNEQCGQRKRKSTDLNAVYAAQIPSIKRPRLTELNRGQPSDFSWENDMEFSETDENQPTVAHGHSSSPRRNIVLQTSNSERRTCEESITACRNVRQQQAGDSNRPLPNNILRHGQSVIPPDNRFSRHGEDGCSEGGFIHPDSQLDNRVSADFHPELSCLWELSDIVETETTKSPIHIDQSLTKSVNTFSPPVSYRPTYSTYSQQSCDGDDLEFTSSNIHLLESLNSTTDMVVRKLPINCPLIKCAAVSILSRAVSSSIPGVKHLQCLFCHKLAPTMKGVTAHLEQCHADIGNFVVSKVNPTKEYSICYFCRHCQFITIDRVIIWIHFQTAHNILGILESCHDSSTVVEDTDGISTELDLSLDSQAHWYRVFVCLECSRLTCDEASVAVHMTSVHPRSPHSNGHFVKVITLLRPRNHLGHLTYRMLLMDPAYSNNRKACFVCSICYFVIFDPRLALSHLVSLHSDMKLLLVCKSDKCDERFVREKAFVEHCKERHRPTTIPMNFKCSVTLVRKSPAAREATEVTFVDND